MEEIRQKVIELFPIGCRYICQSGTKYILKKDYCTYSIHDSSIWAHESGGCLYYEGKYSINLDELEKEAFDRYGFCSNIEWKKGKGLFVDGNLVFSWEGKKWVEKEKTVWEF